MPTSKGFSLRFLGSGNAWSKPPINFNNNILLEIGAKRYLIDCGQLCPLAMAYYGIHFDTIDGVCITHLHGDHVNGLEELLFHNYFNLEQKRIPFWVPAMLFSRFSEIDGEDLWENCLRGSLSFRKADESYTEFEDFVALNLLQDEEHFEIEGLRMRFFPVQHVPFKPSYGIVFDERVVFTSDCIFSKSMIETFFSAGIEHIFHDVTFDAPQEHGVHCSIDELLTLPSEMAQSITLMHYDDKTTTEQFAKAKAHGFQIAKRGMIFTF